MDNKETLIEIKSNFNQIKSIIVFIQSQTDRQRAREGTITVVFIPLVSSVKLFRFVS